MGTNALVRRIPIIGVLLCGLALALPAAAAAAPPGVSATGASKVTADTAVLDGTVNPMGQATTYFFQYGTTTAYGKNTPIGNAGAGTKGIKVSAAVTGLVPNTLYHFQLVASSPQGTGKSADHTFRTAAVPKSVTIASSPFPGVFGKPLIVAGTVGGSGTAGADVVLEYTPFPFTAGFTQYGNTQVVNATGGYAFTVNALLGTAEFRVTAKTTPNVTSPVLTVGAGAAVTIHPHLSGSRGNRLVTFVGSASPPEDGVPLLIQKLQPDGSYRTVVHTHLTHATAGHSSYKAHLRIKRGATFIAYAAVPPGAIYPGASAARTVSGR